LKKLVQQLLNQAQITVLKEYDIEVDLCCSAMENESRNISTCPMLEVESAKIMSMATTATSIVAVAISIAIVVAISVAIAIAIAVSVTTSITIPVPVSISVIVPVAIPVAISVTISIAVASPAAGTSTSVFAVTPFLSAGFGAGNLRRLISLEYLRKGTAARPTSGRLRSELNAQRLDSITLELTEVSTNYRLGCIREGDRCSKSEEHQVKSHYY
jgi:hypothetical protein